MNRLGCLILLVFAAVIGGLVLLARRGGTGGQVQVTTAAAPTPAAGGGADAAPNGLLIPVEGVQAGELVDSWGDARGGGTRAHHAIDILAPQGTPVIATADGTIAKIFDSKLGGHTIYERSADGAWTYYYAHLADYAPGLANGQTVKRGEVLATVGATGDADPGAPHLHFEIHRMGPGDGWWQGTEINPYPILAGKASAR